MDVVLDYIGEVKKKRERKKKMC